MFFQHCSVKTEIFNVLHVFYLHHSVYLYYPYLYCKRFAEPADPVWKSSWKGFQAPTESTKIVSNSIYWIIGFSDSCILGLMGSLSSWIRVSLDYWILWFFDPWILEVTVSIFEFLDYCTVVFLNSWILSFLYNLLIVFLNSLNQVG